MDDRLCISPIVPMVTAGVCIKMAKRSANVERYRVVHVDDTGEKIRRTDAEMASSKSFSWEP